MSKYQGLYDVIISKDHFLKQLNDLVDFSFIYDELLNNYSTDMGRDAKDPIMLFKYLILKTTYELSYEDVVERPLYDMSLKYFLNLAPEEVNLIHPSTLTKFKKLRLKDINLLDLLIKKTIEIAMDKGGSEQNSLLSIKSAECRRLKITRKLKLMAKELDINIVVLSQLSRAPETRSDHRPMLSDLRESGSIEQDVDVVMFLYRDEYYHKDGESKGIMECIVAKNRNGEVGTTRLKWRPEIQSIG